MLSTEGLMRTLNRFGRLGEGGENMFGKIGGGGLVVF